jgi:hypothetical protein
MKEPFNAGSRLHDVLSAFLGAFAAVVLITSPLNVDTSGPDPFYKGPLIFPLMALSLMVLAAIPAAARLLRPSPGATWRLDGEGRPIKTLFVLALLIAHLFGLKLVGLEASSLSFLMGALFYLNYRRPLHLFLIPIIVTVVMTLVFKHFLQVWFPTPWIMEWFEG